MARVCRDTGQETFSRRARCIILIVVCREFYEMGPQAVCASGKAQRILLLSEDSVLPVCAADLCLDVGIKFDRHDDKSSFT